MKKNILLDKIDKAILAILQRDAEASVATIAEHVGLTSTPCWRRIQRLQDKGVIKGKVALLEPSSLGLDLIVFVQIKAPRHDESWLSKFATQASAFEEVIEFYRLSGEYDYLLKVIVEDMPAFDHFYKRLIKSVELGDVTSSFSMEQIKYSTALPLRHV